MPHVNRETNWPQWTVKKQTWTMYGCPRDLHARTLVLRILASCFTMSGSFSTSTFCAQSPVLTVTQFHCIGDNYCLAIVIWYSTQQHLWITWCIQPLKVVLHDFPGPFICAFFRTFQDHLCPFSMSFQDCLIEWISNKSDFHIHVPYLIN